MTRSNAQSGHLVTVLGASEETQQWVDAFIAAAQAGAGDWPHPHPDIPPTVIPLEVFQAAIEAGGLGVIAEQRAGGGAAQARPATDPAPDDPSKGGTYHNVLHSLLGDFH